MHTKILYHDHLDLSQENNINKLENDLMQFTTLLDPKANKCFSHIQKQHSTKFNVYSYFKTKGKNFLANFLKLINIII